MLKRFILVSFLAFLSWPALADNTTGRYQAIPVPKGPNESGDRIMILDTSTGELWQWWDAPAIGQNPGGNGITFMGKVVPGKAPGETHIFQRFIVP